MTITLPTIYTLQQWLYSNLGQRVRPKELLLFYTQITILIESGTSVPLGLEALEKQMPTGHLKQIVNDLKLMVREGQMLSDAMAKYSKVFSPVYVGMIRAGESGGFLSTVLQRIVMLQEQNNELRSTLSSAFAYPLLLMMVSLGVVIFMLTFILPKFIDVYAGSGVPLPLLTQLLLATYVMFSRYWFIGLPLLG